MATYDTIRGQILARVPGLDPADLPRVLQMLVTAARGPEWPDLAQVTPALAGLETLWVEEILDLQEAIAAQQMVSLQHEFMRGECPTRSW
jgi:hypothetical protein